ncbi:MAG: cobalamin-independent methionine synthase II family protein [Thermoplasmata archaeon]
MTSQGADAFRAEVIGSMLRPPYLLEARDKHAGGQLSDAAFKEIEDRAVDECVATQEQAGVDVLTDGEMRRSVFASQLVQATEGFESVKGNTVDWFNLDGKKETSPVTVALVRPIERRRHLSAEEFAYLRGRTDRPVKVTIPSPTMYAYYWLPGVSDQAYPSTRAYLKEVARLLRDEVNELARLGATYIQVDAPEFGMMLDPHQQRWFAKKGFPPERTIRAGVELINEIIEGHPNVTFGLHICRGNDASRYMAKGSYAALAKEIFGRIHADRLLLEYDDERSGDFGPLEEVPEEKVVVLGLVTTKWPREETEEELEARIEQASRYIPLDRLALSTQCGFASVARGNAITPGTQRAKLGLVSRVARRVWDS